MCEPTDLYICVSIYSGESGFVRMCAGGVTSGFSIHSSAFVDGSCGLL